MTAWALVAVPAFCAEGWLDHPCACGEPGCDGDGACPDGHGCLDDPCAWQLARARTADGDGFADPGPCIAGPAVAGPPADSMPLSMIATTAWARHARSFFSVGADTVGLPLLL